MMLAKIRVLPIVILAAMLLLGVKVVELRRGVADIGFAVAWAKAGEDKNAKTGGTKDGGAKKDDGLSKADGAKTPGPMDEANDTDASKAKPKAGKKDDKNVASRRKVKKKTSFTPAEVEVLQKLSGRRMELEQRSGQMAMREKILQATEKRIDTKIGELKNLEGRIKKLLLQHDKESDHALSMPMGSYKIHLYRANCTNGCAMKRAISSWARTWKRLLSSAHNDMLAGTPSDGCCKG